MDYQTFLQLILHEMQSALPPTVTPKLHRVRKNNGLELDGLIFENSGSPLSVTVYLNSYYKDYCDGMTVPQIIEQLLTVYQEHTALPRFLPEDFLNFAAAKKHLCLKLVNRQLNESLLSETPYLPFHDLALVCIYFQHDEQTGCSSILITKHHQKLWNISKDTLFETAITNTPRLMKPVIQPLNNVLFQFLHTQNSSTSPFFSNAISHGDIREFSFDTVGQPPMYVLTNEYLYFGAVCMTFPDVLKNFSAKLGQNLYIIPSSIHEIILIPTDSMNQVTRLTRLVQQVNEECLPEEDILSDHIYFYDRKKHLIQY